jgi:DNA-binding NarL/FixJ family response regulator
MKNLETYQNKGEKPSWKLALDAAVSIINGQRSVQTHLDGAGDIHIIVREDKDEALQMEQPLAQIFIRKACVAFNLSAAESNVMIALLNESDNKVIASGLNISPETVNTYRKNIFRKLSIYDLGSARNKILNHARCLMMARSEE